MARPPPRLIVPAVLTAVAVAVGVAAVRWADDADAWAAYAQYLVACGARDRLSNES